MSKYRDLLFRMPANNFKDLDKIIHYGKTEIALDSDISLEEDEEYPEGIKLDLDNLIIDGKGHTIDANGRGRIFHCTANNITLKNITLKNGNGAICIERGMLNICQSTIMENNGKSGGAIECHQSNINIESSTIKDNTANSGGAIKIIESEVNITNSTIKDNTAGSGGAIDCDDGKLNITKSKIKNNTASTGGAIESHQSNINIEKSTIKNNTASTGGAIFSYKNKLIIKDSTIAENNAKEGGAIYNFNSAFDITKTSLDKNTAEEVGGAIFSMIYNIDAELKITESTLNENKSRMTSGAIHNEGGHIKISDCEISGNGSFDATIINKDSMQLFNVTFRDNQSSNVLVNGEHEANMSFINGEIIDNKVNYSALFNNGKSCILEKVIFENQEKNILNQTDMTLISPNIKDDGKTIENEGYIIIRKSSSEIRGKIYGDGEVEFEDEIIPQDESFDFGYLDRIIHESNNKQIVLNQDISFENYERDYYEGGIELDIDNLIIDGNGHTIDAKGKTRIFIITGENITLKNIRFENGQTHRNYDNPLNNNGGAIKANNVDLNIIDCEFNGNRSEDKGGAICNSYGNLNITESTLNFNTALGRFSKGGGIYNKYGKLTIIDSTFTQNMSFGEFSDGGAIANCKGITEIKGSTFTQNRADTNGGALNNYKGKLNIDESTLIGNWVKEGNGGAICNDDGKLNMTESTLNENAAETGGAIYNYNGEVNIIGGSISENRSRHGRGAIHNEREREFNIEKCEMNNRPYDITPVREIK
ncbi:MAG: hypothetical protein Q4P11_04785 [Methanobrevibacter sp.]|nr:hypothetical protein [Methanobrevibacter sp.]